LPKKHRLERLPTALSLNPATTPSRHARWLQIHPLPEPRSNTTRRAVFQDDLPKSFAEANGVFISQVARLDQLPENERLKPEQVVADIAATGKPAFYEPTADSIIERLKPLTKPGDVVVVFSNGGFDGIHQKLLDRL
jgi:UDP-N-acetylmuramate: L-alanyl-gamma-D-glutamyl-meso-diaminopimelate ligase